MNLANPLAKRKENFYERERETEKGAKSLLPCFLPLSSPKIGTADPVPTVHKRGGRGTEAAIKPPTPKKRKGWEEEDEEETPPLCMAAKPPSLPSPALACLRRKKRCF